jgi:hypothetical protein
MIKITWQIEKLSCYPLEEGQVDVVFSVAWRVDGELIRDGKTYLATLNGSQSLNPYTPNTPFTKYADLQQAQVIGWVQAAMGDSQVAAINAGIKQQIEVQLSPPVVTPPLPWAAPSI